MTTGTSQRYTSHQQTDENETAPEMFIHLRVSLVGTITSVSLSAFEVNVFWGHMTIEQMLYPESRSRQGLRTLLNCNCNQCHQDSSTQDGWSKPELFNVIDWGLSIERSVRIVQCVWKRMDTRWTPVESALILRYLECCYFVALATRCFRRIKHAVRTLWQKQLHHNLPDNWLAHHTFVCQWIQPDFCFASILNLENKACLGSRFRLGRQRLPTCVALWCQQCFRHGQ